MERYGAVTKVKPEEVERYVELHANVWPDVLKQIELSNIQNYSIFLKSMPDGEHYLFSYYEYIGNDYELDMKNMASHSTTQQWWAECKPCLIPVEDLAPGEVWSPMQEVFHASFSKDS